MTASSNASGAMVCVLIASAIIIQTMITVIIIANIKQPATYKDKVLRKIFLSATGWTVAIQILAACFLYKEIIANWPIYIGIGIGDLLTFGWTSIIVYTSWRDDTKKERKVKKQTTLSSFVS